MDTLSGIGSKVNNHGVPDMAGYKWWLRRSFWLFFALLIVTGCCGDRFDPKKDTLSLGIPGGWSFAVMGDSRLVAWDSWSVSRKTIRMIDHLNPKPEFLIDCGDLINTNWKKLQWSLFKMQFSPLRKDVRFYPVIGNHDVNDDESERIYKEIFELPGKETYYSFNHREGHFVILDTEVPGKANSIQGDQLEWLERDLAGVSPTMTIIIFMHRPMFPQAGYKKQPLAERDKLHRLFVSRRVRAVFAGHEHFFNKTEKDGILYIITGGGGARLIRGYPGSYYHFVNVSMKGNQFLIQVVDKEGKIRDEIRG